MSMLKFINVTFNLIHFFHYIFGRSCYHIVNNKLTLYAYMYKLLSYCSAVRTFLSKTYV